MRGYPALLYLSTASALLGSVLFGYHLGVLNTCQSHVEADLHASHQGGGAAMVAALLVGATLGSLVSGLVADRCGPRTASVLNNAALLAGAVLSATAASLPAMLAGRGLAGLGSGAASVLVPRYLAEVAPTAIRGTLGTLTQVCVNVGILSSYLLGLPYEGGADSMTLLGRQVAWWRIMFAAAAAPALLQAATLLLCPESPVWLLRAGQPGRAARALRRLHGRRFRLQDYPKLAAGDGPAAAGSPTAASGQPLLAPEGSQEVAEASHGHDPGWSALWDRRYRRAMVLAAALPVLQQASGINTVVFFSTEVFEQAGLQSPILGSILVGATNLGFTVVAAFLMDRAGRRPLLITSFAGMAACLAGLAAVMVLPTPKGLEGTASLLVIMAFMACFAIGCGPLPFLYLPEILPQEIMGTAQASRRRTAARAFCTSLNWSSNIVVGATFPLMLSGLGIAGSYLVFAAFNAFSAAFMARRMVETNQLPAERIRALMLAA